MADFSTDNNNSVSFIFKKITGKTVDGGTKDVEVMVPLKYLRQFWQTLEMPLTKFEFNLIFISFYYSQFNIRNI